MNQKAVLITNIASQDPMFTRWQLNGLNRLFDKYASKGLAIVGFPSNSFFQESRSSKQLKKWIDRKFDIKFPIMKQLQNVLAQW